LPDPAQPVARDRADELLRAPDVARLLLVGTAPLRPAAAVGVSVPTEQAAQPTERVGNRFPLANDHLHYQANASSSGWPSADFNRA
jgi:hypothetical protein